MHLSSSPDASSTARTPVGTHGATRRLWGKRIGRDSALTTYGPFSRRARASSSTTMHFGGQPLGGDALRVDEVEPSQVSRVRHVVSAPATFAQFDDERREGGDGAPHAPRRPRRGSAVREDKKIRRILVFPRRTSLRTAAGEATVKESLSSLLVLPRAGAAWGAAAAHA